MDNSKEMKIHKMPDKEFQITGLRKLCELQENRDKQQYQEKK